MKLLTILFCLLVQSFAAPKLPDTDDKPVENVSTSFNDDPVKRLFYSTCLKFCAYPNSSDYEYIMAEEFMGKDELVSCHVDSNAMLDIRFCCEAKCRVFAA